jgi:purine-binding chemotaxis protein CheW
MNLETTAVRAEEGPSARYHTRVDDAVRTSWLLCRAGAVLCALPIDRVVEIMRLLPIEQIAGVPGYVRGLSVIRGAPVPVVDLGLIVGDRTTQSTRLVAVRAGARTIALAVEAVLGINAVTAAERDDLPPLLRDAAIDTIAAIGALDSELIVFLRAARLLPDDVLARLDREQAAL